VLGPDGAVLAMPPPRPDSAQVIAWEPALVAGLVATVVALSALPLAAALRAAASALVVEWGPVDRDLVRVEPRVLSNLQAFLKPRGLLFLFRGATAADPSETIPPPLAWSATFPLLESLRSRLIVLEKRQVGHQRST